jgi:hypothetical protein
MPEGFVYVLMNPAFPGYIKVGKTTKAPEERAKELSAATGVPTPFVVAYDAFFADCDRAEQYVHGVLEARGIARTPDREFFAPTLREVLSNVGRHLRWSTWEKNSTSTRRLILRTPGQRGVVSSVPLSQQSSILRVAVSMPCSGVVPRSSALANASPQIPIPSEAFSCASRKLWQQSRRKPNDGASCVSCRNLSSA